MKVKRYSDEDKQLMEKAITDTLAGGTDSFYPRVLTHPNIEFLRNNGRTDGALMNRISKFASVPKLQRKTRKKRKVLRNKSIKIKIAPKIKEEISKIPERIKVQLLCPKCGTYLCMPPIVD
jgi:truncated hemoglobin YjbI